MLRPLAIHSEIADLTWQALDDITAEHGQAFQSALRAYRVAGTERAEQLWEKVQAIWSRAWSAGRCRGLVCWGRARQRRRRPGVR